MNKFKVGDVVELKSGNTYLGKLQNTITSISDCGEYLRFNNSELGTFVSLFKLVDASKHHKHHDVIIAWAKGAKIQYLQDLGSWTGATTPRWDIHREYRVKPTEPTELEKLIQEHKAMGETIDRLTKEMAT